MASSKKSIFSKADSKKRHRFNENMDKESVRSLARSTRSLTASSLAQVQNAYQANKEGSITYVSSATKLNISRKSKGATEASKLRRTAIHKQNILDVVNKLSEGELEKVSEMLKQSELDEEEQMKEMERLELGAGEDEVNVIAEYNEPQQSQTPAILPNPIYAEGPAESEVRSVSSKAISALHYQLSEERCAREKLEDELAELKV